MTSAEIRNELEALQRDRDNIKTQLDEAKRRAAAEQVYSDRGWLSRAESAYRTKGRQIGKLQAELSAKLKEEKPQVDNGSFERTFIDICREIYPEIYHVIVPEALRRMK